MLAWEKLTPAVDRAAGIVASNYPAHHNISDIKQECWVWVLENKNTVSRIVADSEGTLTALEQLLVKAATTHLRKEDAQVYGYGDEDRFFYSVDLIKSILEVIFDYEDWQSFASSQDAQPKARAEPATGGNNLASYADVKSAVEKLPEDYYNLIVWRYKYHYTFAAIGEETGRDASSVRQRLERALRAVQSLLGETPLSDLRNGYDGRREAHSSAVAQHIVEKDYEG